MSDAQSAARKDRKREQFAVYPANGAAFLTDSRSEAVKLAAETQGSWCRVPADFRLDDVEGR